MKGVIVNLVLAIFSILCCLLMGEGIVRLLVEYPISESFEAFSAYMKYSDRQYHLSTNPIFRRIDDLDLGWEPIPGIHRDGLIRINSQGFRGPEYTVKPDVGLKRIAVVGDSETFGELVSESDTFVGKLQGKLTSLNLNYEVLNFGIVGYNTEQEFALLKKKVANFNPDVVILYYVFNDPELPSRTLLFQGMGIFKNSYLYNLIVWFKGTVWKKEIEDIPFNGFVDYYKDLHNSKFFERTKDIIREVGDYCAVHDIRFILLIAPELYDVPDLSDGYPYYEIHSKLKDLSSDRIQVVDPILELRKVWDDSNPHALWVNDGDPHKNGIASEAIANEVSKCFLN